MWPRRKRWSLMGGVSPVEGTINQPDPNARFRQNPFPGMIDPNWSVSSSFPAKQTKKFDFSKLDPFRQALEDLDPGPEATAPGGKVKFGRGMPAALGFSLPSMGGRLGEQEAMAQARREEELQRRRKLLGGGY